MSILTFMNDTVIKVKSKEQGARRYEQREKKGDERKVIYISRPRNMEEGY